MTVDPPRALPGLDVPLYTYTEHLKASRGMGDPRYEGAFPSALSITADSWRSNTLTIRERAMLWFMNTITEKPEWERKVFDDAIVAKWRTELTSFVTAAAEAQEPQQELLVRGFSDEMYDWCIKELRDKAKILEQTGYLSLLDAGAAVYTSDSALTPELNASLRAAVKPLEDVPEDEKDWHPGSDNKVLDLVHPSLWCLVFGRTRVLRDRELGLTDALEAFGSGEVVPVPASEAPPKPKKQTTNEDGELVDDPDDNDLHYQYTDAYQYKDLHRLLSTKFQWLPAEVEVVDGKATFVSYVNNLHPTRDAALYGVLEELLTKALPLLEATYDRVLSFKALDGKDDLVRTRVPCMTSNRICSTPKVCGKYCSSYNCPLIPGRHNDNNDDEDGSDEDDDNKNDEDKDDETMDTDGDEKDEDVAAEAVSAEPAAAADTTTTTTATNGDDDADARGEDDDESGDEESDDDAAESERDWDAEHEIEEKWYNETHPVGQPEPSKDYSYIGTKEFNKTGPWFPKHKRLQVIVKLANIHLTPENPTYDGGSWHIEGQLNERIVATALYYYDNENITDSRLGFRSLANNEEMTENFEYEQNDFEPFKAIYGVFPGWDDNDEENCLQHHGDVLTKEGRLLVFPNVYQHRVSGFELADKTRPGHRKIVAMFLVDPITPVVSTAQVPPQQLHWGVGSKSALAAKLSNKLPPEIANMVYDEVKCPYGAEEAKKLRDELIEERKTLDKQTGEEIVRYAEWSFCEH